MASNTLDLDLRQIVYVLSDALDYVGVDDIQHGKRVAYMAHKTGQVAGLRGAALDDLFHAALLHDCGVSSTREHKDIVDNLDWAGCGAHCIRGDDFLKDFGPLAHLAPVIGHHHSHWQDLEAEPGDLDGTGMLQANCIYLTDRVDAILVTHKEEDPFLVREEIWRVLDFNRGTRFAPELVDCFLEASAPSAFWFALEPSSLGPYLGSLLGKVEKKPITLAELRQLAVIFARIVDAKSEFTAEHSLGVARVARLLGKEAGLEEGRRELVEVAALLHDLGKLKVPDRILEKPAPLDRWERAAMDHHSFHTFQILRRIDGFEKIAEWAAFHHEGLDGGGYPFGHNKTHLDFESRLVAVADVFQALAQDRPYRGPLTIRDVMAELKQMVGEGKLDQDLVALAERNAEACWKAAIGEA